MIVETRKTAAGTEYWDTKEKRIRFVPKGKEPKFEVTENPKSMILGVDLASGPDRTIVRPMNTPLDEMTVAQLKEYAASNEWELPSDMKKKEDIIHYLQNKLDDVE
ncbi:hypothetical protein K7887_18415 [Sutcliffiella horikoshii]|uniref:hypothetical protein n=1 Tax=Sutcliffiella horikoshii TaxID=79883 RepID=UPI001CC14513|nr:hypothetical protein [Sutcliffiella horikoshii]UAL46818.1 hypothetical protein K7887_18415 [Sutcliffiella horikoshii]